MADGSFMVDLAALGSAIDQVSGQRDAIQGGIQRVKTTFTNVEDHWKSPSGTSFVALATHFNGVTDELMSLLDEGIGRMRTAYNNYAETEATNTGNYH
jgi:WXG100 family type VII secretion target